MPPPPTSQSRPPRPNIRRGPASAAAAASAAAPKQHPRAPLRRIIWTGAVFAITVAGAFYGAGLKSQQEYGEEVKKVQVMSIEDRISALQDRRAELFRQRVPVERKLEEVRGRIAAEAAAAAAAREREGGGPGGGGK